MLGEAYHTFRRQLHSGELASATCTFTSKNLAVARLSLQNTSTTVETLQFINSNHTLLSRPTQFNSSHTHSTSCRCPGESLAGPPEQQQRPHGGPESVSQHIFSMPVMPGGAAGSR